MQPPTPPDAAREIEFVKSMVARHFPVYDVKVSYDVVQFFCRVDETTLEDHFEQMRQEMAGHGYIPMMTYDKGEHVVIVAKKPPAKYRSTYVNLAMLVITFLAVTYAGVLSWVAYVDVPADEVWSAETVMTGILVFALPLMGILGVHELAHYFAARRHRVAASMPFFIPSIPPLGTFGAFISLRDPIPNRRSLLEIGIAGPLAGLILTIPVAILGLMLTNSEAVPVPDDSGSEGVVRLAFPMIYLGLSELFPIEGDYLLHPTAFAAWVGFLVTALNLLPAGQLDGGHIARALLGAKAKYASWIAIALLIGMSFFYLPWMIFAILILFLGTRHPPPLNDITKLDVKRKGLGLLAFVILVVAFVPVPMAPVYPDYSFKVTPLDDTNETVTPGESVHFQLLVESTGNVRNNITFEKLTSPAGWLVVFKLAGEPEVSYEERYSFYLSSSENATLDMRVTASVSSPIGENVSVVIRGRAGGGDYENTTVFAFAIEMPTFTFWVEDDGLSIPRGTDAVVDVVVNNTGLVEGTIEMRTRDLPGYVTAVLYEDDPNASGLSSRLNLTVPAESSAAFGARIFVLGPADPGEKIVTVDAYYFGTLIAAIAITIEVT